MTRLYWWAPETAFIITLLIGKITGSVSQAHAILMQRLCKENVAVDQHINKSSGKPVYELNLQQFIIIQFVLSSLSRHTNQIPNNPPPPACATDERHSSLCITITLLKHTVDFLKKPPRNAEQIRSDL